MTIQKLPTWARELLESERVARLAFRDGRGDPRVLPITYAVAEGAAWSVIDDKPKRAAEPARVRWLRARPAAALCVDVYSDDWNELAWVQLLGRVAVLEVDDAGPGMRALAARYAALPRAPAPRGPCCA